MEPTSVYLIAAVLIAAILQSATGVGFGIIVGPLLLAAMNDATAIQVSIILNLSIAAFIAPTVWRDADTGVLRRLSIGVTAGSPLGYWILSTLTLFYLKLLAVLFILIALTTLLIRQKQTSGEKQISNSGEAISVGAVAGIMGGSLAMPGPVPAAWMSARGFNKTTVRATIVLLLAAAYSIALLLQILTTGVDRETLSLCLKLAAPTAAGIVIGQRLSQRISENAFRRILIIVLVATIATLLYGITR